MTTATVPLDIRTPNGLTLVLAQPATPGLYVHEIPEYVNVGDPCRWAISHHSGLQLAAYQNPEDAHRGTDALADWADWTGAADALRSGVLGDNYDGTALLDLRDRIEQSGGHLPGCSERPHKPLCWCGHWEAEHGHAPTACEQYDPDAL